MKKTYIASPLGNKDPKGIEANMEACRLYKQYAAKYMKVEACALHDTLPKVLDDNIPAQREEVMRRTTALLLSCEQVYMCGDVLSNGMLQEATLAAKKGLPIMAFNRKLSNALAQAGIRHTLKEIEYLGRNSLELGGYKAGDLLIAKPTFEIYNQNGFCVHRVEVVDVSEDVTKKFSVVKKCDAVVTGRDLPFSPGTTYEYHGNWERTVKGVSMKVDYWLLAKVSGMEAVIAQLVSIPGIGEKTAARIYKAFGDSSLDVIRKDTERLVSEIHLRRDTANKIADYARTEVERFELTRLLVNHGFTRSDVQKVCTSHRHTALKIVKERPYTLVTEDGFPFAKIDPFAKEMGIPRNAPARIRAAIMETLVQSESNGSTGMPREGLMKAVLAILSTDTPTSKEIAAESQQMLRRKDVYRAYTKDGKKDLIYRPSMYTMETEAAHRVIQAAHEMVPYDKKKVWELVHASRGRQKPDKWQDEAVFNMVMNHFCIVLGGPGRGKTTIVKRFVKVLKDLGEDEPTLVAFTGRAASRIHMSSGMPAYTIDSTVPLDEGGNVVEGSLSGTILNDEASMTDMAHLWMLLKAAAPDTRFVLMGDINQLPSIGAGNCLADLVHSEVVPVCWLKTNFRQQAGSLIATNADAMQEGKKSYTPKTGSDFFMVEEKDQAKMQEVCVKKYRPLVKKYGLENVFVLCPQHKGDAGVTAMNNRLQTEINPPAPDKTEFKFRQTLFRLGDPVMHVLRNNKDTGIVNGDVGKIVKIGKKDNATYIEVSYPDYENKCVQYVGNDLEYLALAYAGTVHKSQGSEYKAVLLCGISHETYYRLLTRNLVYTSLTRARDIFVFVGESRFLERAVLNDKATDRTTLYREKLIFYEKIFIREMNNIFPS